MIISREETTEEAIKTEEEVNKIDKNTNMIDRVEVAIQANLREALTLKEVETEVVEVVVTSSPMNLMMQIMMTTTEKKIIQKNM